MQLMRLGPAGAERPAVRDDDGTVHDLAPLTPDIDGAFLASGGLQRVRAALQAGSLAPLKVCNLQLMGSTTPLTLLVAISKRRGQRPRPTVKR